MAQTDTGMHVEVKYAGGLQASVKRMMAPVMNMYVSYAKHMKYRIINQRRLGNGRMTGFYAPVKKSIEKLKKKIMVETRMGKMDRVAKWQEMLERKQTPRRGRRNYQRTGALWRGLTIKQQKGGAKITINFQGKSPARGTYLGSETISHQAKAYHSMTNRGRHREGIHVFTPTPQEFDSLKAHYAIHVAAGMIKDVKERQKVAALIKKAVKQDKTLQSTLDRFLAE